MIKRITAVLIFIVLSGTIAYGEPNDNMTTKALVFLDEAENIAIYIDWDNDTPDINVISPGGKIYDPALSAVNPEDSAVIRTDQSYILFIKKAERGQWQLSYDLKTNEDMNVSIDSFSEGLWITDYSIEQPVGDSIAARFTAEYPEDITFSYQISAVYGDGEARKPLAEGYAQANTETVIDVNIAALGSYSAYKLRLDVNYDMDGIDIFDWSFSEIFVYMNPNALPPIDNYTVTYNRSDDGLVIEWSEFLPPAAEEVMICVWGEDPEEPEFMEIYDKDETSAVVWIDPENDSYEIEIRVGKDGIYSEPNYKALELDKSKGLQLEITDQELINTSNLTVEFKNATGQVVEVEINGVKGSEYVNGDGQLSLILNDDWNEIKIKYPIGDNIYWEYYKRIFVDKISPVIHFFESYDHISTTEDFFIFVGTVSGCNELFIGNDLVPVTDDGSFISEVSLESGENKFVITAVSKSGNKTTYTAAINKVKKSNGVQTVDTAEETEEKPFYIKFLPLFVTLGAGCLFIIYILLFWKRKK